MKSLRALSSRPAVPTVMGLALMTCLLPVFPGAQAQAQEVTTAQSNLAGFHKVTVRALSSRLLGVSFVRPTTIGGHLESTAANTLSDTDVDFTSALAAGTEYWVEITSGAHQGMASTVTSFTANSITTEDDLSLYAAAGDTYAIRPLHTIASLFGATNSAGLRTGNSASSADTIVIPDGQGGTQTIYYSTSSPAGWRNSATGTADASATPVYHVDAITITRRWLTSLNLTFAGELRTRPTHYVVQPGQNPVSVNQPVSVTLANNTLQDQVRQGDSATADLVWIPNTTTTGYKKYYYTPDAPPLTAGWKLVGSDNTDRGTIPLGTGIVIERRDPATATMKIVPDPAVYGGL